MRQSLSTTPDKTTAARRRHLADTATMWGAAAASASVAVVAIIDQAGGRHLYRQTASAYAAHGVVPDPGLVYGIIYSATITLVVLWSLTAAISTRRGWWPPVLSATSAVISGTVSLLLLTADEYGEQVLAPTWGLLLLIPTALGVVATILLWRRRRAASQPAREEDR